jgi:N-acetyl-anhydromuramyl-L-alanine amidase AmpD
MAVYPGSLQIPSPFHSAGYPGFGKPHWIIIHGTASGTSYTAQDTGRDFQSSGNSVHFIVGYDGTVVQCVDTNNAAWGNGVISGPAGVAPPGGGNANAAHDAYWDSAGKHDPNSCTLSIEHSKSGGPPPPLGQGNQSQLSPIQQQNSFKLIAWLCQLYGIPPHYGDASGGITGHYSMDPVNRAFCPGPYPWQELFSFLGGGSFSFGNPFGTALPGAAGAITQTPPKTYVPLTEQVHETLIATPGFYGIALSLDEAEQFPGWVDLTQPYSVDILGSQVQLPDVTGTVRSAGASMFDNFTPAAIRGGLVLVGVLLFMMLFAKAISGTVEKILPEALEAFG